MCITILLFLLFLLTLNVCRRVENFSNKRYVCILYVGQMREKTVLKTQNHVDWINKQFPPNKYIVHVYFVTDHLDVNELLQHSYFGSKVKNILLDYNYKGEPYIHDTTYMPVETYHDIVRKSSKQYDDKLNVQITNNLIKTYPYVYRKNKNQFISYFQFKKLYLGILLKRLYENTNKIQYDFMYKVRPDITFLNFDVLDKRYNGFYCVQDLMFGGKGHLIDKLYDLIDEYGKIDITCLNNRAEFANDNRNVNSDPERWIKAPETQMLAYLCNLSNDVIKLKNPPVVRLSRDAKKVT